METYTRFLYRDGAPYRIAHGGVQIRMDPNEVYTPDGSSQGIKYEIEDGVPILKRLDPSGREQFSIRMVRDALYKVGPKYAFRVVMPDEENDPILRVAREIGIPVSKVSIGLDTAPLVLRGREPPMATRVSRESYCGAQVAGDIVHLNSSGFFVETFERPIRKGTGTFVSRLVVGPRANAAIVRRTLQSMALTHTPEWDIGGNSGLIAAAHRASVGLEQARA